MAQKIEEWLGRFFDKSLDDEMTFLLVMFVVCALVGALVLWLFG